MNEYQDQVTWFEVSVLSTDGTRWIVVSEHDQPEDADWVASAWEHVHGEGSAHVYRRHGLPE